MRGKEGKKGRKVGKGKWKAQHSKWGSYAGIFAHSQAMKLARMERRKKRLERLRKKREIKNGI